jgi:hypothetical protein
VCAKFICFSCCILFSGSLFLVWGGALTQGSLGFFFLYHFHDSAEAGRPQRAPARAFLAAALALRLLLALLRDLGQHDLAVFVSLNDDVSN